MASTPTVGDTERLADELVARAKTEADPAYLQAQSARLDHALVEELKARTDHLMRADARHALAVADLILRIAEITQDPLHRAQGLLAKANVHCIALGEFQRSLDLYDEAAAIYEQNGRPADRARSQIGKVSALGHLGRYEEAIEAVRWAGEVLEAHGQLQPRVGLIANLGLVLGHAGRDAESLEQFDRAARICRRVSPEPGTPWYLIQLNRSLALRALGRFEEAIAASRMAVEGFERLGEMADAARSRRALALTYFVMGRSNEALQLLDKARDTYIADGRHVDAQMVQMDIGECLLQIGRFEQVLAAIGRMRREFAGAGARDYLGQAILQESAALAELGRLPQAQSSIEESRGIFVQEGNETWVAIADLVLAALLLKRGLPGHSLDVSKRCASVFSDLRMPLWHAQALLSGARSAIAMEQTEEAAGLISSALEAVRGLPSPAVRYRAHACLGMLAHSRGDRQSALREFDQAIHESEQIRGHLMVEYRPGFQGDKEEVYGLAVRECLDLGDARHALEYVERAKSRSLIDLLALRLDLGIRARTQDDEPLVAEISRLRQERDRRVRRWQIGGFHAEAASRTRGQAAEFPQEALEFEARITELWHRLLVRKADYAQDAALWTVRTEPVQPYLEADTLLLEYYRAGDQWIVFGVTSEGIEMLPIQIAPAHLQDRIGSLWLNLRSLDLLGTADLQAGYEANARALLGDLGKALLHPANDLLERFPKVVVVPHGPLHYIPFHALIRTGRYLIETHEVTYLPASSTLRFCREAAPRGSGALAFGHSQGGLLPHAVEEARTVGEILRGDVLVEEQATIAAAKSRAGEYRLVHFATHGEYRADGPLFSGLSLADGWLTTLDVFNLRLQASLVTLSACESGRHALGGGDELLGLMRAFLAAGTSSLLLTLWTVEDTSARALMEAFYSRLATGAGKAAALRQACLQFLFETPAGVLSPRTHPYHWAAFYLVGEGGPL